MTLQIWQPCSSWWLYFLGPSRPILSLGMVLGFGPCSLIYCPPLWCPSIFSYPLCWSTRKKVLHQYDLIWLLKEKLAKWKNYFTRQKLKKISYERKRHENFTKKYYTNFIKFAKVMQKLGFCWRTSPEHDLICYFAILLNQKFHDGNDIRKLLYTKQNFVKKNFTNKVLNKLCELREVHRKNGSSNLRKIKNANS